MKDSYPKTLGHNFNKWVYETLPGLDGRAFTLLPRFGTDTNVVICRSVNYKTVFRSPPADKNPGILSRCRGLCYADKLEFENKKQTHLIAI